MSIATFGLSLGRGAGLTIGLVIVIGRAVYRAMMRQRRARLQGP